MSKQSTVLFIDDEEEILDLAQEFFSEVGIDLITSKSASHSIEVNTFEKYDAIISDYRMPGITGEDFFKKIREEHDYQGVMILISGHQIKDNQKQGYHIFNKPIDFQDFAQKVKQLIQK